MRVLLLVLALALTACAPATTSAPSAPVQVESTAPAPISSKPSVSADRLDPIVFKYNKAHVNLPSARKNVGIGSPVIVTFKKNVPKKYRSRVAQATRVSADGSPVLGGWWWASPKQAHFRPLEYWPGQAKVRFFLDLDGVRLGDFWGKDLALSFTTSEPIHAAVDGKKQSMRVFNDQELLRIVPVSTGGPGHDTRNGTKLVIDKKTDYTMRGTDSSGPYAVFVPHALRVTWSGEFIHSAPWATYRLGRYPGSHGCTNASNADAAWMYEIMPLYTPVRYKNMTGPGTDPLNGVGDWNVPDQDLDLIPYPPA